MKKLILFTTISFSALISAAQIVVTQADYPTVGTDVTMAHDSVPNITIGAASSTAQSWDFSSMNIHTLDTHNFVDPATTQFGSNYGTSNLADTIITQESVTYFNKSATLLETLGFAADPFNAGQNSSIPFTDPQTIITFPSTYGTNFNDDVFFRFSIDASPFNIPTVDSIRLNHHATVVSVVDAHGDITIPGGGPFTTIRQLTVEEIIDSVFVYSNFTGNWTLAPTFQGFLDENPVRDTIYRYTWIANGEDYPVCEVLADTVEGNPESASFKLGYNVVGMITDNTSPTCPSDTDGEVTVTGLAGTPPYDYLWDANAGNQTTQTATGLAAGSYDVTITDAVPNTYVLTATVVDPNPSPLSATTAESGPSCGTCTDGTAQAIPSGGVSPYTYLWDANAANQTTQTATGLGTGNYDVTVTDACGETFAVTATVPVGIEDLIISNAIKVFPNPTSGKLFIQSEGLGNNLVVEVRNVIGQQVRRKLIDANGNIDISDLNEGVYMLSITTDKGIITKKINLAK